MEKIYQYVIKLIGKIVPIVIIGIVPIIASITPSTALAAEQTQSIIVKGAVKDDTGAALPGVNVIEKGTANGTVTDAEGNYTLTVSSGESVLVFSFVGTITQEVKVGEQNQISVSLQPDTQTLSEVIVVGYGTRESKDVTGAMKSVKAEDFNAGIINSPEQLLQGKVSGVNVTSASGEPGGSQSITIRGPGGVRTGNTPLFVVDGLALDNSSTGGSMNPLNFINPQDIASIDLAKDASATAIYGARGANGVIFITTKKGRAGALTMKYSADLGVSSLARPIKVLTADEYRRSVPETGGVLEDLGGNTDWQKEITRTAITQNHNISLSGGADKFTYYASVGMQNQEGILRNSDMKRYSGRINVTQKVLNDRVNIDMNLNATYTDNGRPPIESVIGTALTANPTYYAKDVNGNPASYVNFTNPLVTYNLTRDNTSTNRIIGNITPSVKIIEGLVYKLNYGLDYSTSVRDEQSLASAVPPQDGRLQTTLGKNSNSLIENYLTYDKKIGVHAINALLGHSYQSIFVQKRIWSINKFPISSIEPQYNPGQGTDLTLANNRPFGSVDPTELQSVFGRVNYAYKDKYLATVTYRVDGSSKFGANNKYAYFPSFSLGWRLSEEEFLKGTFVNNLKIRAGWGRSGNQEVGAKLTKDFFTATVSSASSYPLSATGAYPAGLVYQRVANKDLKWETSTQTDVGIDFGFLEGKLSGTIDAFTKESSDILLQVYPSDPIQAVSTTFVNTPNMKIVNSGLEIALMYENRSNNFTYSVGGNVTFISNEVKNSPYSVIPSGNASGSGLTSATINGYVSGQPIGTFFLKQFTGFDAAGQSMYYDKDGDGLITDNDRIAAGSALPTTMYNFSGRVAYKGFDLTINFNGVSGNKIYDNTANSNFYKLKISKGVNVTQDVVRTNESITNAAPVSTRFLKDGSFLRLNNMTVGYNFNTKALGMSQWISALRFSVTGQNLFVITNYDGFDPEVNIDRTIGGVYSYGIDYLSYPKARSIVFALNVTF